MLRLILLLVVLGVLAFAIGQLADLPGNISVDFGTIHVETSLLVGIVALLAVVVILSLLWSLLRFVFHMPALISLASRARRRTKGYAAVSRGMVALGAGDQKTANLAAKEAERHLKDDPLALLLKAQSAQLSGDKAAAESTFSKMTQNPATRILGLRGLHVEALRRGNHDAAYAHAAEAQKLAAVPWAAEAVLEHHSSRANWAEALAGIERSAAARLIDRSTADRQRAVLKTAIALDRQNENPDEALKLARQAIGLSPDFIPANVLAARLLLRQNDTRRARKLIEAVWRHAPHPDLAEAYLDRRSGDKASERLNRAETLLKMTPDSPDARLAVAKTAIEARNFDRAGEVLKPLAAPEHGERPTVKACLAMAELEEARGGASGKVREWLARAARAPRDMAWIADGVVSDVWAPISPVTGKLDAFHWEKPKESLAAYVYEPPATPAPELPANEPKLAASPAPVRPHTLPVIFPQANAPDDPGLDDGSGAPKKRFGGLLG